MKNWLISFGEQKVKRRERERERERERVEIPHVLCYVEDLILTWFFERTN